MSKSFKWAFALSSAIFAVGNVYAAIPNTNEPTTFLGPTLRGSYTSWIRPYAAYSLRAEVAPKNERIDATFGWKIQDNERIKFSGEYLQQRINFPYFSGNQYNWVRQAWLGMDYQYIFGGAWMLGADLNAFFSYAPNKTLSSVTGTYITGGVVTPFTDLRHIAGSRVAGFSPGLSFMLWQGGMFLTSLNWDVVQYDHKYPYRPKVVGLGGTVRFTQAVSNSVGVDLLAAVRTPFNVYRAELDWTNFKYYNGRWVIGVYGEYVAGKEHLVSTSNAGISVSLLADCMITVPVKSLKGDFKGESTTTVPQDPGFLSWMNDPAVYLPQVMAISESET